MGERVLFLGAGASAHFEYPITSRILPEIVERLDNEQLFGPDANRRQQIRDYLQDLLPGLDAWRKKDHGGRDWRASLPWITETLSLLDYLLAYDNSLGRSLSEADLLKCRTLLEQAMSEVLARGDSRDLKGTPDRVRSDHEKARAEHPQLFGKGVFRREDLVQLARWVLNAPGLCTVVTTNYDMLLESEIYPRMGRYDEIWKRIDFGFSPREPNSGTIYPRPPRPAFRLYKLHGSLNWLRCARCDRIYINPYGQIAYLAFQDGITSANTCHCYHAPLQHVMVTPSFVRSVHDPNLQQIWQNALEALRSADHWFIIGYSLPQEDVAIRSLLLRAYHGRTSRPHVDVFVADEKSRASYELQFPGCVYHTDGLGGFLRALGERSRAQAAI